MSTLIGQASIDERGMASGGKAGDQSGAELNIRNWYSYPWNCYLECTDANLAQKAAKIMKEIINSRLFGYDQGQRWTCLKNIVANGKKVKGAAKGECDCSSLVLTAYALAGLKIEGVSISNPSSSWGYTGDMKSHLLKTGKFKAYNDEKHIASGDYAKVGGIYLNEVHHVCMALSNGSKIKTATYLTLKKDAGLYPHAYKDVYGRTSIKKKTILKGSRVRKIADDNYGWCKVQLSDGTTGYIVNSRLSGDSTLSSYKKKKLTKKLLAYNKPSVTAAKKVIPAGKIITIICSIPTGSKKGWNIIAYGGKEYYVKEI